MNEEWLMSGAMVPVDMETTAALVAEIKRLIDVVGGMALEQPEQGPYPEGNVVGPCICGSWPGGKCLKCPRITPPAAQPEQEPVAWIQPGLRDWLCVSYEKDDVHIVPVYPHPPQRPWVGLTDEEFLEACQLAERGNYLVAFQRIQTRLKERNT